MIDDIGDRRDDMQPDESNRHLSSNESAGAIDVENTLVTTEILDSNDMTRLDSEGFAAPSHLTIVTVSDYFANLVFYFTLENNSVLLSESSSDQNLILVQCAHHWMNPGLKFFQCKDCPCLVSTSNVQVLYCLGEGVSAVGPCCDVYPSVLLTASRSKSSHIKIRER